MLLHRPVLLTETINGLQIDPNGIYLDATFGRGGHSREILKKLSKNGKLFAIDKDPEAIDHANKYFSNDKNFHITHRSFKDLGEYAKELGIHGKIKGILLDLGVSSPQLDNPERGFSFMHEGPLDMRMDLKQNFTAATVINTASLQNLTEIFKLYGEERFAKRIAQAIIIARTQSPILTTLELAKIVKDANPKWEKHKHPATRVFQALRIYVNNELEDLKIFLNHIIDTLDISGRIVIISFHSLEDRLVKQFMKRKEKKIFPIELPILEQELLTNFKIIGKAIKASDKEVSANNRARSAVLRIGEKLNECCCQSN